MCRLGRKHVGKTTRTRKCRTEQSRGIVFSNGKKEDRFQKLLYILIIFTITNESLIDKRHHPV